MVRIGSGRKRQARILVVDDEQIIALSLATILEKSGYKVAKAFSGEEAVATAACFEPDLLLTDISMGAMSGIEAATEIVAMVPECKVLFLSGHASMSGISESASKRLVYSFASKPLHPLDLLNTVAYMLSAVLMADEPAVRDPVKNFGNNWMMNLDPAQC